MVLAIKSGLDPEKVVAALSGGAARSWVLENRSGRMIADDYPLGFRIALHLKDVTIALELAREVGAALPVTALASQIEAGLVAQGHGDDDNSALARADPRVVRAVGRTGRIRPMHVAAPRLAWLPVVRVWLFAALGVVALAGCDTLRTCIVAVSHADAVGHPRRSCCSGPRAALRRPRTHASGPYSARLVLFDHDGRVVADVSSDADGTFRLSLPPGDYVIQPAPGGDPFPRAEAQNVTVVDGEMTQVEIDYETARTRQQATTPGGATCGRLGRRRSDGRPRRGHDPGRASPLTLGRLSPYTQS